MPPSRAGGCVVEESADGLRHRRRIVGSVDDEARLAVRDSLGRAARTTGDLRDPARCRLEEDDAESLLFEAAPAHPTQHREHVTCAVQGGFRLLRHPTEKARRRARPCGQTLESLPVAARARHQDHQLGMVRCEQRRSLDHPIHPLARYQPAQREDCDLPVLDAERSPSDGSLVGIGGAVEVDVDAGGHLDDGQRSPCGPLGLDGRVVACGDDQPRLAKDLTHDLAGALHTAGKGQFGAVEDDAVGVLHTRRQRTQRECGIEHHQVDVVGGDGIVDLVRQPGLGDQHGLWHPDDPVVLRLVEGAPARMRAGQDDDLVGGQPSVQLPQIVLDAAHFGRVVVGDQQMPHGVPDGGPGAPSTSHRRSRGNGRPPT
jgi:hypothetical protein